MSENTLVDHVNYPRTERSEIAVHASGHRAVAYFSGDPMYTGRATYADGLRYAKWLRGLGYTVWTHELAEFDASVSAGVL